MSAAVGGLEAIPATATAAGAGARTPPAVAAAERVQQLRALLAQVEHHSSGTTFASALGAAQSAGAESDATAGTGPSGDPTVGGLDASTATAGISLPVPISAATYPASASSADGMALPAAYSASIPSAGAYPAATPNTAAYTSATPSYTSATPSTTDLAAAGGGSSYTPLVERAAARYGLDPSVLYGLIQQESGFDPAARSSAGALGLTQLMPSTAASLGVTEPLNPAQSIEGGARYLSQLLQQFGGNTADALAAYNAGPGAVQQYGGVPPYPETQQYVTKVLGYAASFRGGEGVAPAQTTPYPGAAAIPSAGSAAVSGAIA